MSKLVLNKEVNGYEGYREEHSWTHICALWELPYAHALILMQNIDVMYQECNVVESIVSMFVSVHHLSSVRGEANLVLHFV
jgi:hypothetical protein